MLTITQLIGIIIAISLTALFIIIGYQIVLILQELKETITKINQILDDANRISQSVAEPVVSFSGFLTGLKDGAKLINLFTSKFEKKSKSSSHD